MGCFNHIQHRTSTAQYSERFISGVCERVQRFSPQSEKSWCNMPYRQSSDPMLSTCHSTTAIQCVGSDKRVRPRRRYFDQGAARVHSGNRPEKDKQGTATWSSGGQFQV